MCIYAVLVTLFGKRTNRNNFDILLFTIKIDEMILKVSLVILITE